MYFFVCIYPFYFVFIIFFSHIYIHPFRHYSSFKITFLDFRKTDLCTGLVKNPLSFLLLVHVQFSGFFFLTWSATREALILRCLVRLLLLIMPLRSRIMSLMLSCNNRILPSCKPCASLKCLVHITFIRVSSAATRSVSIELLVLIVCRVDGD